MSGHKTSIETSTNADSFQKQIQYYFQIFYCTFNTSTMNPSAHTQESQFQIACLGCSIFNFFYKRDLFRWSYLIRLCYCTRTGNSMRVSLAKKKPKCYWYDFVKIAHISGTSPLERPCSPHIHRVQLSPRQCRC